MSRKTSKPPRVWRLPKDFPIVADMGARKNPQSIRRFFFDFIKTEFDSDCSRAAVALEASRKLHKNRSYRVSIKPNSLYDIIRDQITIKYFHIESIAIFKKIPVSMLLMYTRIYADQYEKENAHEIGLAFIGNFSKCLDSAFMTINSKEKNSKPFNYSHFTRWCEFFNETNQVRRSRAEVGQAVLPGIDDL